MSDHHRHHYPEPIHFYYHRVGANNATSTGTGGSYTKFFGTRFRYADTTKTLAASNNYWCCMSASYSPDYVVTNPIVLLCNWYCTAGGAEQTCTTQTIEGVAINVVGSTGWVQIPMTGGYPFTFSSTADGYLVGPASISIPSNSLFYIRIAGYGSSGDTVPISTDKHCTNITPNEASDSGNSSYLAYVQSGNTQTMAANGGFSAPIMPTCMIGTNIVGRPALMIHGDSIGWGKNMSGDGVVSYGARMTFGFLEMGFDNNATSKRICVSNSCIPGTNSTVLATDLRRWRNMDAIKALTGQWPFDEFLCQHGSNSGANARNDLITYYNYIKTRFPGIPISQVEMTPRPASTDFYQSLANQTPLAIDTYPTGERWLCNVAVGGSSGQSDPNSTFRQAGYIISSFAPWYTESYDKASNRDKLKIKSWSTTLATAYPGGNLWVNTVDTPASAGLGPGDYIYVNSTTIWSGILISIATSSLTTGYILNLTSNGAAANLGATVAAGWNDHSGLHPSPTSHLAISNDTINWKIARGWV